MALRFLGALEFHSVLANFKNNGRQQSVVRVLALQVIEKFNVGDAGHPTLIWM